jgi:ergothioneine biosynthesis protein EgtB
MTRIKEVRKPHTTRISLPARYKEVRGRSELICKPLQTEDYVVQPIGDVSPPKWHLGHTTWFFETFILAPNILAYKEFDPAYNFVFNSYYETVGARVIRTDRGNLSRPTVADIYRYRAHVDQVMCELLEKELSHDLRELITLGLNHEEQHQELLMTDIKYILGHNPLFPTYNNRITKKKASQRHSENEWTTIEAGIYEIGSEGEGFCFDNELGRHRVYLDSFSISCRLVTNEEYLEFINTGGYAIHRHWHSEGLDWVNARNIQAPLYWHFIEGKWYNYTLQGLQPVDMNAPVCHISFYEAAAYADWRGMRLPTEFEWEAAAAKLDKGSRWEWTNSAYLPYPGYKKADGAIGEYNGKFMVNQMVLRGASEVTPPGHSRDTYRNFFHPHLRWQYTGIRLAH